MSTLEQLFGAKEQIQLLRFFLFHPDQDFTMLEIGRKLGKKYLGKKKILYGLVNLGAILEARRENTGELSYHVNQSWLLFQEFRALFIKAQLLIEQDLIAKLQHFGNIRLLILTGMFVGERNSDTDMLIVGKVNHPQVSRHLKAFERSLDQETKYTILSVPEFLYRKNVGDRFLYHILENRHLVVIDTINNEGKLSKKLQPVVIKRVIKKSNVKKKKVKKTTHKKR